MKKCAQKSPITDFGTFVTNLEVKFDSGFKFKKQISGVGQKSFYQLRQIAKVKPI